MYQPVTGLAEKAIAEALNRAEQRMHNLLFGSTADGQQRLQPSPADRVRRAGIQAVGAAFAQADHGQPLSDDDAAWLLILLRTIPVRDHAWGWLTTSQTHHDLLRGLLQRATGPLAAPPACLLAAWALMSGHGTIASIALQRAEVADPDYRLIRLLSEVADAGLLPDRVRALFKRALTDTDGQDPPSA